MSGGLNGSILRRLFGYGCGCCRHPEADERNTSLHNIRDDVRQTQTASSDKHSYLKGEVPSGLHIKPVDSLQRRNSNVLRAPSYFWHVDD
jgi:hypothetical protein